MSGDINVQTFSGKVNITSNLLVGSSHLFVDTTNNRVGITTANPDAGLHVNSNAYVDTNFRVGSDIAMNVTSGRITAGSFEGNGSLLSGVNSDSGSWVKGSSSNIHLAVSTDNVGIGVLDSIHKLDVDGDINISTGSTLRVGGTPAVFSNWTVHTNASDIYRSSGNVGIGVTSPDETLDILGSMRVGNGDGMLTINERTNSGFDGTARNETIALQTTIDGRTLAQGAVYGHEPRVVLALQPDFGYVGVGKVDPKTRLHVKNETDSSGTGDAYISGKTKKPTECLRLQGKYHSTGSGALLRFTNQHNSGTFPNTSEYNLAGIAGYDHDNSWGGGLAFYTSPGSGTGGDDLTSRMVIDSAGNIGIGTSSPSYKLHVSAGDNSITYYGPNSTWYGELAVGAASDKTSSGNTGLAQCICTNGNLHLDAGHTRDIYMNYYRGAAVRVNNILRMEGSQTEWLTMGGLLTHRYTHNTYSWGRWNGPHHLDVYSNTNFTAYNGGVNTVPFYINFYSHAPIRTSNYTTISSDDRIKINEKYIENATQTLLKLKPQNYDKLACLEKDRVEGEEVWFKKESGLITQDVYYDAPELRHLVFLPQDAEVPDEKPYVDNDPQKDPDYSMWGSEPAGLQYQGFIPYLIKSNQEIYEDLQTTKEELQTTQTELAEERTLHETTRTQLQDVLRKFEKLEMRTAYLESALIS